MTVLRQRMTEDMQVGNLSPHTQASYLQQVLLFARHFAKSPDVLAAEQIRTYQLYLVAQVFSPLHWSKPSRGEQPVVALLWECGACGPFKSTRVVDADG